MVLGALVADAASVGLHWIYAQEHIRNKVPASPEFTPPNQANYDGAPAYFAHGMRKLGQCSHYAAQSLVMMDALAGAKNGFIVSDFANQFRSYFGYGGGWIGYIDNAIRETLNNFTRMEDEAFEIASQSSLDGTPREKKAAALKAVQHLRGEPVSEASSDLETQMTALISQMTIRRGADDQQMSATAKLPPLIAAFGAKGITWKQDQFQEVVADAIRATNEHVRAHEFGLGCAAMMSAALTSDSLHDVVDAGLETASQEYAQSVERAKERLDQSTETVTAEFGMACDLIQGVPSIVHNVVTAPTYRHAIQRNIYAGGDSCGRAMILGALLGAVYGVGGEKGIPEDWIAKLDIEPRFRKLLDG